MAENRLTYHNGYRDKNGKPYNTKHNQRENFKKPKNADKNEYWDYQQWGTETFSESEKTFYKYSFSDHVKAHNEKCKKRRQYARCTTIEEYRSKHPPEETLLYIGRKNVDPKKLKAVFDDFRDYLKRECNNDTCGIELLNAALHMDETTPHIQFRKVYWYTDKDGNAQVSQNKALEGLGFERPDKTTPEGRFNNAKITFDAVCREKLFEIAKSHGVELETEPLPKDEVSLPLNEYIAREKAREVWKEEQESICVEIQKAKDEVESLKRERNSLIDETGDLKGYLAYKTEKRKQEEAEKQKARDEEEKRRQEQLQRERQKLQEEVQKQIAAAKCLPTAGKDSLIERTPTACAGPQRENAPERVRNAPETTESKKSIPDTTPLKTSYKHYDVQAMLQQWDDEHEDDNTEMSL